MLTGGVTTPSTQGSPLDGLSIEQWKQYRATEFSFAGLSRNDVAQLRAKADALIAGGHGPDMWDWLLVLARKLEQLLNSFITVQPVSVSCGPLPGPVDYVAPIPPTIVRCDYCHKSGSIDGPYAELPFGWRINTVLQHDGLSLGMYACPNCQRL